MAAHVLWLGFRIPASIASAEPYQRQCGICQFLHAPRHTYPGPGTCSLCKRRWLRIYYDGRGRAMCSGCLDAVVGVKVIRARGIAHRRSIDPRPSEAITGEERGEYLLAWSASRSFWEKAIS